MCCLLDAKHSLPDWAVLEARVSDTTAQTRPGSEFLGPRPFWA